MFLLQRKAPEPDMTWFKVDDSFHSHPKVLATEPAALGLWVIAGSWSSDNLTEGFVPDHVLPRLLPDSAKLARALVTAGLWKRMQGGYTFHDWTDFNPTAEQEKRKKQARAEAGRKGGLASGKARSKPRSKPEANASPVASGLLEPPSRPVPKPPSVPPGMSPILFAMPDVQAEGEGDQEREQTPDQLIAAIRRERPDWSTSSIERALAHPSAAERPWPLVCIAALIVARDPESKAPGRLAHDGPWWAQAAALLGATAAPKPPWCGKCDERTRQRERDDGRPARCPDCHPSLRKEIA